MTAEKWVPVYKATLDNVTLLLAFLQSDEITGKIVPDVTSPPLRDPAAHNLKSEYTLHLLLVAPGDLDRARELVEAYLEQDQE